MALGEKLCNGRLALKQTTSEVAAATHMKVQVVEDLEREDFSRLAAPIYAKGFIKIYAEHVGLDPKPLIEEYVHRFVVARNEPLGRDGPPRIGRILGERKPGADEEQQAGGDQESPERDLFDLASSETHDARRAASAPAASRGEASQAPRVLTAAVARVQDLAATAFAQWRSNRPAQTQISALFARRRVVWSIAAAAAVVLIVAIVVAAVSGRESPGETSTFRGDRSLRLAVEPPPPYLD